MLDLTTFCAGLPVVEQGLQDLERQFEACLDWYEKDGCGFVGRAPLLLASIWGRLIAERERVQAGRGGRHVVHVVCDPGSGKTAIATQIIRTAFSEQPVTPTICMSRLARVAEPQCVIAVQITSER